jgi:hypothetical protein
VANSRNYVDPPAFTPAPFGLLTSLPEFIRTPSDPHWQMGVNYESLCGTANTTFDDCIAVTGSGAGQPVPPSPAKTDTGADLVKRGATPFTVFTEVDCSAPGFWDRAEEVIGDAITRMEQYQVEKSFWTGLAGGQLTVFPHLQASAQIVDEDTIILQTAATQASGAAIFDVVEGLARLEGALADCYDGVGIIHAPVELNAIMQSQLLVTQDGPRWRTGSGNIVVFGHGYQGTGPTDAPTASQPANSAWMYATGSMFIYRSPVLSIARHDSIDRAENTVKAIAERTYVLGWDCCHFAVQVSLGGVVSGASGSAA